MSPARPETPTPLAMHGPSLRRRVSNSAMTVLCYTAAVLVMLPLALILWHVVRLGLPAFSPAFFLHLPKPVGESGGGMVNAIVGTGLLVLMGTILAVPIGVGAGLYLAEHGNGRFGTLVRTT